MRKAHVAIGAPLSLLLVLGMSRSLTPSITASALIAGKTCSTAVVQQFAQEESNDSNMNAQPGDANSDNSDQSGSQVGDENNDSPQASPSDDNSGESPQMSGNPDDSSNPDQNEQNPEDQQNQQNPDDQNQSNPTQP